MRSLRLHPAESSQCAPGLSRFGFRQVRRGSVRIGIHRHLTIRSSRPHVVASAACFTLRLHASAAPPRVGLTQALGGRKAFGGFAFHCSLSRLRLALLFGRSSAALLLRLILSGALTLRVRCVGRLRKRCLASVSMPATDAVISDRSG